jgi:hypothetical protein
MVFLPPVSFERLYPRMERIMADTFLGKWD